ncbi:hypothetical protein, variant [Fonticula alba]|nr:hypothetical protein, variant [Fonticula alba]KCV68634.1 hypothetical protein, variant [Fonticula alba]|eukprot:XP_009497066.1 hypothetical protein, variant [Fonticula alba]
MLLSAPGPVHLASCDASPDTNQNAVYYGDGVSCPGRLLNDSLGWRHRLALRFDTVDLLAAMTHGHFFRTLTRWRGGGPASEDFDHPAWLWARTASIAGLAASLASDSLSDFLPAGGWCECPSFDLAGHEDRAAAALLLGAATAAHLCINPDVGTAWNARKDLLEWWAARAAATGPLPSCDRCPPALRQALVHRHLRRMEARAIRLALSKQTKAHDAWAHRRWFISWMKAHRVFDEHAWTSEITACGRIVELYPKNYMAWTHRKVVASCYLDTPELIVRELAETTEKAVAAISDHAALQHRQFLLTLMLVRQARQPGAALDSGAPLAESLPLADDVITRAWREFAARAGPHSPGCHAQGSFAGGAPLPGVSLRLMRAAHRQAAAVLEVEFSLARSLIRSYPGREALWSHLRFLLYARYQWILRPLLDAAAEGAGSPEPPGAASEESIRQELENELLWLDREIADCRDPATVATFGDTRAETQARLARSCQVFVRWAFAGGPARPFAMAIAEAEKTAS